MRWILILILFISCTDNSDEDMKLFQTGLSNIEGVVPPPIETIKVLLLTGQSNAVGFGENSEAPSDEIDQTPTVQIYQKGTTFEDLNIAGGNNYTHPNETGNWHGLELGMSVYAPEQMYLVKWGVGSTAIIEHLTGGSVYEEFYPNFVIPSIPILESIALAENKTLEYHLVFFQGEQDSTTQDGIDNYASRLNTWVDLWRGNIGSDLHITLMGLTDTNAGLQSINADLEAKADSDPLINYIFMGDEPAVGYHFTYAGYKSGALKLMQGIDFSNTP